MHESLIPHERLEDHPAIEVLQSTHGRGVFSCRRFPAEVTVGEIQGVIIHDADYGSDYCIEVGEGMSLEPAAPFRFLNHACEPNCEVFMWENDEGEVLEPRLFLGTIRPVAPGEELTIDYAWPADSAIPCGCGLPSCRGWIVDAEEVDDISAARKQKFLPPR